MFNRSCISKSQEIPKVRVNNAFSQNTTKDRDLHVQFDSVTSFPQTL